MHEYVDRLRTDLLQKAAELKRQSHDLDVLADAMEERGNVFGAANLDFEASALHVKAGWCGVVARCIPTKKPTK